MFTECDEWNKRYLKNLFINKGLMLVDVCRNYGISKTKMQKYMDKYGIRSTRGSNKKWITKRLLIDCAEKKIPRKDLEEIFCCKKTLIGNVLLSIKDSYVYPNFKKTNFDAVIDDAIRLHHEEQLPISKIANKLGVPRQTLTAKMKECGFAVINWGEVNKRKIETYGVDVLVRMHHEERIPTTELAALVGVPYHGLVAYFNRNGIKCHNWNHKVKYIKELRDKEWLQQKHLVELLSCREIGELLGCSNSVVEKAMKKLGLITRNPTTITDERFHCRDTLYEMHVEKKMSGKMMAREFGCDTGSVNLQLKKFGIDNISYKFLRSDIEKDLADHLKDLGHQVITSSRSLIYPKEIDIHLPEFNIAFEFNGLYWHSTEMKTKDYHQEKTIGCLEQGVSLFHIWENEVIDDLDGLLEKIENLLDTNIIDSKLESIDKVLTNVTGMFIPRDTLPLAELNERFDVDFIAIHEECPVMSDKEFPINPARHLQITKLPLDNTLNII